MKSIISGFFQPQPKRSFNPGDSALPNAEPVQTEAAQRSAGPDLQDDGMCNENAALVCIGHWVLPKKLSYAITTRASWPIGEGFCLFSCSKLMFPRWNWHTPQIPAPLILTFCLTLSRLYSTGAHVPWPPLTSFLLEMLSESLFQIAMTMQSSGLNMTLPKNSHDCLCLSHTQHSHFSMPSPMPSVWAF